MATFKSGASEQKECFIFRWTPWPEFWDSPELACLLKEASAGIASFRPLKGLGVQAVQALAVAEAAVNEKTSHCKGTVKAQNFLSNFIVQALYPDPVHHTLMLRLHVLAPTETEAMMTSMSKR